MASCHLAPAARHGAGACLQEKREAAELHRLKLLNPETVRTLVAQNGGATKVDVTVYTPSALPSATALEAETCKLAEILAFDVQELISHTTQVRRQQRQVEQPQHVSWFPILMHRLPCVRHQHHHLH